MLKSRFSTYNDGVLNVYVSVSKKSSFGAAMNEKKQDDLSFVGKLAFNEMSKRDEDMDFAESQGRALSIKVKTRLCNFVDKQKLIVINNILYSIYKIDLDKSKDEMYIYLEEVRKIS